MLSLRLFGSYLLLCLVFSSCRTTPQSAVMDASNPDQLSYQVTFRGYGAGPTTPGSAASYLYESLNLVEVDGSIVGETIKRTRGVLCTRYFDPRAATLGKYSCTLSDSFRDSIVQQAGTITIRGTGTGPATLGSTASVIYHALNLPVVNGDRLGEKVKKTESLVCMEYFDPAAVSLGNYSCIISAERCSHEAIKAAKRFVDRDNPTISEDDIKLVEGFLHSEERGVLYYALRLEAGSFEISVNSGVKKSDCSEVEVNLVHGRWRR